MRRALTAACVVFTILTGVGAAAIVAKDRRDTMRAVEERTSSMARMIMAHGDAAAEAAGQVLDKVYPLVAEWDFQDPEAGQILSTRLRELSDGSSLISSAWVLDAAGINRVDSWGYPSKPMDGSDRPYFIAHLAGAPDPVVTGDTRPGAVTGKERFTFSRAVRNPDGSLRAVIVTGVYKHNFDALYGETVNWPGARAGLYTMAGDPLARVQTVEPATPTFVTEIVGRVNTTSRGTAIISAEAEPRIVSWVRSDAHPQLFSTTSQPLAAALDPWFYHATAVAGLTLLANVIFYAFAYYLGRAANARRLADANALAVREVNHRVKNSLQLVSSLFQMRSRKSEDSGYQAAVRDITTQLMAVAETYRFVESSQSLESVDIRKTLEGLCGYLQETFGRTITFVAKVPIIVEAVHATALAVVVNELVTNAVKHGDGPVKVTCASSDDTLRIMVQNAGKPLPKGFVLGEGTGFGLRAAKTMVEGLSGKVTADSLEMGGAVFEVAVPLSAVMRR